MRRPRDRGRRAATAVGLAVAALAAFVPHAGAATTLAPTGAKVVRSLAETRNQDVIRQEWDLSCGAAAIATLFTYQLRHPVTERQVALAMLRRTAPELVRSRLGFSLLDLKIYAATQGFAAAAFEDMSLDDLDALAPAVVPIRAHGFRHFVVYRGRREGRVLVADPAFGNRTLPEADFRTAWAGGIGFIVFDPSDPHPPNRMGAPPELMLAPGFQASRARVFDVSAPAAGASAGRGP
jgi:predicted double-glycine peptidase